MTLRSNYFERLVTTSDSVILSANDHRKSLLIQNPTSTQVNITLDGSIASTNSFFLTNAVPPLYLDYEMFGAGIQREIHAISQTSSARLVILEGYE